jgi:hypothetical protein
MGAAVLWSYTRTRPHFADGGRQLAVWKEPTGAYPTILMHTENQYLTFDWTAVTSGKV